MKEIFDRVLLAGGVIARNLNIKHIISSLTEQLFDITGCNIACFYSLSDTGIRLLYRRGNFQVPEVLNKYDELFQFIIESKESVVLTERKKSPFISILLNDLMESGIAAPIGTNNKVYGFMIMNSINKYFFNRKLLSAIESISKLAGQYFHNSFLHNQLIEYTRKIESLERYQENIFSSMTNMLITTDITGNIKYFNPIAQKTFSLKKSDIGKNIKDVFSGKLTKRMLSYLDLPIQKGIEIIGAEGIYRSKDKEVDFSLNVTPLKTKRKKLEGITLLFHDQSREKELEKKFKKVKEERRLIKDIFSRYLSEEVVSKLMQNPNLIHLGGDKKEATIFFADIRGYTSFSEGKDPEYIVNVLNEYFSEAVEIIIKYRGFIDKFIGDCIMAAWGVPLQTEEEDARLAVSCALEIQEAIKNPKRKFFRGEASNLKIGIGMHTGPLVAGNLGSSRRLDYTVIGDTVNIASRLEGIAGPGEIIITNKTKSYLNNNFKVKSLQPVKVKGKDEPIKIYKVIKKVG